MFEQPTWLFLWFQRPRRLPSLCRLLCLAGPLRLAARFWLRLSTCCRSWSCQNRFLRHQLSPPSPKRKTIHSCNLPLWRHRLAGSRLGLQHRHNGVWPKKEVGRPLSSKFTGAAILCGRVFGNITIWMENSAPEYDALPPSTTKNPLP